MIRAAIFDLDGTLVDSEGFWRIAEREVFGAVGIDITEEMSAVTAPMTTRQVAEHWHTVRPWSEPPLEAMEAAVVARVAAQMREGCQALPGVSQVLSRCTGFGWRLALASNSPAQLCHLALDQLRIAAHFQVVVSADDVVTGKPDPAIYLLAAERLGVPPGECLAFEDSMMGVRAARAAGMRVVGIPSASQRFEQPQGPHLTLRGLHEFDEQHVAQLMSR